MFIKMRKNRSINLSGLSLPKLALDVGRAFAPHPFFLKMVTLSGFFIYIDYQRWLSVLWSFSVFPGARRCNYPIIIHYPLFDVYTPTYVHPGRLENLKRPVLRRPKILSFLDCKKERLHSRFERFRWIHFKKRCPPHPAVHSRIVSYLGTAEYPCDLSFFRPVLDWVCTAITGCFIAPLSRRILNAEKQPCLLTCEKQSI